MNNENDPWEEARRWLERCRTTTDLATKRQIELVCYLDDEIDRLTKRVKELEAEIRAEDEEDVEDVQAALANEKRGPIETVQIVIGAILAIPLAILFAPFVLFPLAAWCVIRFVESVEPVVVRWFPGLKERKGVGNE